ncbi:MAG: class I SAM-dependent methyltransferase [Rhodococcus sp. (in: high G+C Gram-positive bacteria)]
MNTVIESDGYLDRVADAAGLAAIDEWSGATSSDDVDALDRLVLLGLADHLARITDIAGPDGSDLRAIEEDMGACHEHRWIVARWLTDLVAADIVVLQGDDRFTLRARPRRQELRAARDRMTLACRRLDYAEALPTLLLDSLRHAIDLLQGRVSVQSILFPDGDASAALEVYGSNVVSRYLNAAAASVVADLARRRTAPLRILELGAGVGATSEHILQALESADVENYVLTDVSPHLLRVAQDRITTEKTMTFLALDITANLAEQLQQPGVPDRYDVVLAATMAHNAIDVGILLREAHDLLAQGGALVLIETVVEHSQSLTTMPFALSMPNGSGPPARTDSRAGSHRTYLTVDEWTTAMTSAGLRPCVDLPRADHPLHAFSQRLLVAVRPDPHHTCGDD